MSNTLKFDQDLIWIKNSKRLRKGPLFTKLRKVRSSQCLTLFIHPDIEETYTVCIGTQIFVNNGI